MTAEMSKEEEIEAVMSLLSVYRGQETIDSAETRQLTFIDAGLSSVTLASIIVELEDRLDRMFDFEAFAGMETIGDLLKAVGVI